jgi:phytoene dehydrogenase-like protein
MTETPRVGKHECDAVIIGAGLAGLVAGALLAKRGQRVLLLEPAEGVGGGGGSTQTRDGFWFDFGYRDGRDVGDCVFPVPEHCLAAAREADVSLTLAEVKHGWRVHKLPEGPTLERSAETFDPLTREILGFPRPDALQQLLADWSSTPAEESQALIGVSVGDWLAKNVPDPELRTAVLRYVTMTWHSHPEQASVGRFMQASHLSPRLFTPDDPEVGGMQGLMQPWARAILEHGGQIATDCRPVEILVEAGKVTGALGVDRHNVVVEAHAPVVIFTFPVWELFELLDDSSLPDDLVRDAHALEAYKGDLVGWQAALSRLPRLRSTGEPETHDGWNRFLAGRECRYQGGYQMPSLTSRRAAPEGKHVLCMVMNRWLQGGSRTPQPWAEGQRALQQNIEYLRGFYTDLEECVEWSRYIYCPAPQAMTWWHTPGPRHGLEVPGVEGLLLAAHTLEASSSIGNVDMGAFAGHQAATRAHELLS